MGALATASAAVVVALGGVAGATVLMRTGQGEVVLQLLLSAIFVNATLAAVFVGMRVAPAFSEPALRAYPLTRADRLIARHATSLLEPLWLLVSTVVLALALGASIVGPSFPGAALAAAILLVGTSYLLARALAGLVAWLLSVPGGSLIVVLGTSALLMLPLAPALLARIAARQGSSPSIIGTLNLTPPFAAAAAMTLPLSWPVIAALIVLGGWAVALIIVSARLDRFAGFRPAIAGSAAAWEHPCDRLAALAGARSAPLVGKILRYYLRSGVRYNVVFAVPAVALMARHYDGAILAFALGAAPALGFVATQPLSVNLFGIDGPAVRRYFLLSVYARTRGARVISVSSLQNAAVARRGHSSGAALPDVADVAIDNCVEPEDAQVDVGQPEKVAAASTIAAVAVAMAIVAETGARLAAAGHRLTTFVSPNVEGVAPDHNLRVFDEYARRWFDRPPHAVIP